MNASKENARKAKFLLEDLLTSNKNVCKDWHEDDWNFIREFLKAAERKLPSEESYTKEKKRHNK